MNKLFLMVHFLQKKLQIINNPNIYINIIDALVNDGYIIINNALDPKLPQKLKAFAQKQTTFKQSGISSNTKQHIDQTKRSDSILWLNEDSHIQSEYLNFCKQLQNYLNRELYLGIKSYESHFSIYTKGDFYEKHLDSFKNSNSRKVTTLYYLNEYFSKDDAGELCIYNNQNKLLETILPQANTLVVFLSERFPHEVKTTKKDRYSIAGWYRVDSQ